MERSDERERPATLGERLTVAGERLRDRHLSAFGWATVLAPALRRAELLSQAGAHRFDRDESGVVRPLPTSIPAHVSTPASAPAPAPALASVLPPAATDVARPVARNPGAGSDAGPAETTLPVDVRARLAEVAGPGAAVMQVRTGARSDTVAREQHADAVTAGAEVHVRAGRYQPDTAEGFALLAHEASHVTALLSRGAAGWSAAGGPAREEEQAGRIESRARAGFATETALGPGPTASSPRITPGPAPAPAPPTSPRGLVPAALPVPAGHPMRADVGRPAAPAPAPFDLEALRRSLIEDLMSRVRTDFERGA